ncbi:hypothetical protein [Herbaspirillum sp. NPDC101396]|uniref:hypothetical protein n=1 Tax=Herbaspirillum sp. NPDC101396 TaxID=3364005 RepID=UPI00383A8F89
MKPARLELKPRPARIADIEQTEQPAAQRKFALEGDNSAIRDVQTKIDALAA